MLPTFFRSNRDHLVESLQGGLVVLTAYTSMQLSNDCAAVFEQESNFWWLTGIDAPDWWVIIDGRSGKSWLVSPTINEINHIFDGSLTGEDAKQKSGIGEVLSPDEASQLLRRLARQHSIVYSLGESPYKDYFNFALNPAPKKLENLLERNFQTLRTCRKEIATLRAIKQPNEIVAIKSAIDLTIDTLQLIKKELPKLRYEYEVEAEISYQFRRKGAGLAFESVVACGANACTIHHIGNSSKLGKKQLLLLDVGARVDNYCSDIARTYIVGTPTKRQLEVSSIVRSAHKEIIALLGPDILVQEYQKSVDTIMKSAFVSLGLITNHSDEDGYRKYFPHAISHGLGIDPHDPLGGPKYFKPGMVLTVEPGVYIPKEGIGFRVEDDILITEKGNTNLSARLSTDL